MNLLLPILAMLFPFACQAFPTGAGGCNAGESAAIKGHGPVQSQTVSEAGYTVDLSTDGDEVTITLTAPGRLDFLGFLFRVEDATVGDFETGIAQVATACADPAVGLTHISSASKSSVTANFIMNNDGSHTLDLTVVQTHPLLDVSKHYYESFTFTTGAPEPTPSTPTPTTPSAPTTDTCESGRFLGGCK